MKQGVLYPRTDSHVFLGLWTHSFTNLPRALTPFCQTETKLTELRSQLLAQIKTEVSSAAPHTLILSSEYVFSGGLESIRAAYTLESELSAKIKPIVYMREPVSYYLSYIQQVIKATNSFPQPAEFEYPFVEYLDELEKLSGLSLIVRAYDRSKFPAGDAYLDFKSALSITSSYTQAPLKTNENESLSAEAMLFMRDFIKINFGGNPSDKPLVPIEIILKVLNGAGTKPSINPKVKTFLASRFSSQLNMLEHKYGIKFDVEALPDTERLGEIEKTELEDILETYDENIYREICHRTLGSLIKYIPYKLSNQR